MDLVEFQKEAMPRHPWETSRIKIIKKILTGYINTKKPKVLDVGCGDCFAVTELFKGLDSPHIDAVDINLTENEALELTNKKGISVYSNYDHLQKEFYDTIIAQDVIEHVEDDVSFLKDIISKYASQRALIFITVPAFNSLYSSHDSFLGHIKRYNKNELHKVLNQAGLQIVDSGYLFFSLLILRFISVCFQRRTNITYQNKGVGAWNHGKLASKCVELALVADNCILFFLNRFGVTIPGLSVWSLCKKPQ